MTTTVIKKYKNRKLYDSRVAKYITLEDVKHAILSGESVRIVEHGTHRDVTTETLAQILSKVEALRSPDTLHSLIRG